MHSNRQLSSLARILCRINKQFLVCECFLLFHTRFDIKLPSFPWQMNPLSERFICDNHLFHTLPEHSCDSQLVRQYCLPESHRMFQMWRFEVIVCFLLDFKPSNDMAFAETPCKLISPNSQPIFFVRLVSLLYVTWDTISVITLKSSWREKNMTWHSMELINWSVCFSAEIFFGPFWHRFFRPRKMPRSHCIESIKLFISIFRRLGKRFPFVCTMLFTLVKCLHAMDVSFAVFDPVFKKFTSIFTCTRNQHNIDLEFYFRSIEQPQVIDCVQFRWVILHSRKNTKQKQFAKFYVIDWMCAEMNFLHATDIIARQFNWMRFQSAEDNFQELRLAMTPISGNEIVNS